MRKKGLMEEKSYQFSLRIIKLYKYLVEDKREYILSKQILMCGTSIGANLKEAYQGESTADFIHKLSISLKEASETEYWLELLKDSDFISLKEYESINQDCVEIIKLLITSIKTTKSKKSTSNK